MKLARFDGGRLGVVIGGHIHDVTEAAQIDPAAWPPVGPIQLIARFKEARAALQAAADRAPAIAIETVKLENPVPWPNKLIAIPVNYQAHAQEMSSPAISKNGGFFVLSNSSLSGAGDAIVLPNLPGRKIHHEAELAVIIGKGGRHISRQDALSHVFGFACLLYITVRGKQERAIRKSYDTFTPLGPWIVTADEVGDPSDLDVRLWVNGELTQQANTRDMIVDIPDIIAMCSAVMTLEPGDIIATGTGEGVGPIADNDRVRIDISRVAEMTVAVRQGSGGSNIAIPYTE